MLCIPIFNKRGGTETVSRHQRTLNSGGRISEVAKRIFLEKADEFSDSELIALCRSLNARISQLSGHLIREKNRANGHRRGKREAPRRGNGALNKATAKLVKKHLGKRLTKELTEINRNGNTTPQADNPIRDALDAWSISCIYYAMTPLLFGLKLRSTREIEEIKRSMSSREPELAQYWTRIRLGYRKKGNRKLVENIRQFDRETREYKEYIILEDIHRLTTSNPERQLQESLHWRALLYKHELKLDSYKIAIKKTERTLLEGLEQVFAIAGIVPPTFSSDLRDMVTNIVQDAATLAKSTKSATFSQSVEVMRVPPEQRFDKESMTSVENVGNGKVKCTVSLGLHATGRGILLKPEVLLT